MRDPAVVLRNDLAVEQRLVDAEHFERRRNGRKARGPIERFSRQQKNLATVDPRLDPVAIVLDLVNPGPAAWRLVGQQRQTRLEEGRQPAGLGSRNRRCGGLSFGTCSARAAHSAISRRVRRKAYSMTRPCLARQTLGKSRSTPASTSEVAISRQERPSARRRRTFSRIRRRWAAY
jgi:hypothetical protein